MNPIASTALIAAFNALGSLYWTDVDFVLSDVGNTDHHGVSLSLTRDIRCCGESGAETYSVHFTWDELTDPTSNILGELALTRWEAAKRDLDEELARLKAKYEKPIDPDDILHGGQS